MLRNWTQLRQKAPVCGETANSANISRLHRNTKLKTTITKMVIQNFNIII